MAANIRCVLACNGEPSSPVLFPAELFDALMRLEGKDGGGSILKDRTDVVLVEARAYELWDVDTARGTATHNGAYRRLLVF